MGGRFLSLPRVARVAASFGVGLEASAACAGFSAGEVGFAVCEACASGLDSGGRTPVFVVVVVVVVNCSSGWFFTGLPGARVAARAGSVAAGGAGDGNSSACWRSPGDLNVKSKHERNKREIRLYRPHDNENETENRNRIKNKRLQMRNQRNEETGREQMSNLLVLGRERDGERGIRRGIVFIDISTNDRSMRRIAIERKNDDLVPFRIRSPSSLSLSLSLSLSYLPPELDVAIEKKAESTNREEPAWKRTSLGVRMDGCDGLTVCLHGSDERRRKLRRSHTIEMVEITSRSIGSGSCKRGYG
ncbi:hypothetical protein B296_00004774 [Ensete ventricosum]|uniref:Uncharacterized protein n=1 Tax=Ensete ventricosum TaxID=4639 RepID=A0A426YV91_ENSVE|nr:hypothetical protein B296_00004774 [Ensete ventricosum]